MTATIAFRELTGGAGQTSVMSASPGPDAGARPHAAAHHHEQLAGEVDLDAVELVAAGRTHPGQPAVPEREVDLAGAGATVRLLHCVHRLLGQLTELPVDGAAPETVGVHRQLELRDVVAG